MIGANVSVFSIGKAVGSGPRNLAPVITSSPVTTATETVAYSYQVQATDPEGGSLTYTLPTKPTGMTISGSGLIAWTPSSVGSESVVVRVTDNKGAFAEQSYSIAVAELPYRLDILVIGGGGGGGGWYYAAGGGGAGGMETQTQITPPENTNFSCLIGAGGSQRVNIVGGLQGSNSSFSGSGITDMTGYGGGAGEAQFYGPSYGNMSDGGCGGGAGVNASTNARSSGGTGSQGGDGGGSLYNSVGSGSRAAGGGGGDSEDGVDASMISGNLFSGRGGNGTAWLDNVKRAGGGGGGFGSYNGTNLPGGAGQGGGGVGGGTLSSGYTTASSAGSANTGGGGGGGSINVPSHTQAIGSNGGSGVIIIRYSGAQRGTGGTITASGGYTYHTFTSSGTFNTGS